MMGFPCLNSVLRILVRRGAVFGAHSTRTTEQSAALLAYWASTTLNTTGCYALAAWRGASKHAEGAMLSRWYADVGVYLLTTLLWEALAPPAGCELESAVDGVGDQFLLDIFKNMVGSALDADHLETLLA